MVLTVLALTNSAASACQLQRPSAAETDAWRALEGLRQSDTCPEFFSAPCRQTYQAAPREVARLFAQALATTARRSGSVWTVARPGLNGEQMRIQSAPGGTLVKLIDTTTAYELLLSRLQRAEAKANTQPMTPMTCAQLGLISDRDLTFKSCQVSWRRTDRAAVSARYIPIIHFTLGSASDRTVKLKTPLLYSAPLALAENSGCGGMRWIRYDY